MKIGLYVSLAAVASFAFACGSSSASVASVSEVESDDEAADRAEATPTTEAIEGAAAVEAALLEFTQCMRDEGLQLQDPVVDSDGNVQRPQPIEGFTATREQFNVGFEVCGSHLEGITLGTNRPDETELADNFFALAECLREQGLDVDDPDTSLPGGGGRQMLSELDFDDPKVQAALEECSFGETFGGRQGGGPGQGGPGQGGPGQGGSRQ